MSISWAMQLLRDCTGDIYLSRMFRLDRVVIHEKSNHPTPVLRGASIPSTAVLAEHALSFLICELPGGAEYHFLSFESLLLPVEPRLAPAGPRSPRICIYNRVASLLFRYKFPSPGITYRPKMPRPGRPDRLIIHGDAGYVTLFQGYMLSILRC